MDTLHTLSVENDLKLVLKSNTAEPTNFRNSSHSLRLLEDLQSLRKNEILCDIRFKTDDNTIVFGHKNVLIAASPYFRAMFINFEESNKDLVNIREMDSAVLQLLVDYIYTGEIMVTNENVQVLLPAANVLQLDYVYSACIEFLQTQMDTSNCFSIKAFADLHNCTELLSFSETFIKKQFLEVVKSDDFLSLSCELLIEIISCNDLAVPFEEKVFESVMKWVEHDLDRRKVFLPELMEHVRLPLLASTPSILKSVIEEPLLKNCPKYNDIVSEALHFNLLKSFQYFTISQTIRCKPRLFDGSKKIILMFNRSDTLQKCFAEWYDPSTNQRNSAPEIDCHNRAGIGVIRDQLVFAVGGVNRSSSKYVSMLNVYSQSPCWEPMVDMLVSRRRLGVGVLDDCIYAVGGQDKDDVVNSVEVFDIIIQKWKMVTSMTTNRSYFGIGVLNNRLYAIGGWDSLNALKSVEFYEPTYDTWTLVEELSVCRIGASIGVLDGVIYAIGGYDGSDHLKSVEAYRPSDGVWSLIADMHMCRYNPGVVTLDGFLYVLGGENLKSSELLDTFEVYNPTTNCWSMETMSKSDNHAIDLCIFSGVIVERPPHFISD